MTSEEERFDVLAVAAHAPDLQGLRRHLGDELRGRVRGLRVIGKAVGLGAAAAGAATMRRIIQTSPRAVVLIGTCGVYPGHPDWQPHDIVVPPSVRLVDHATMTGESTFPEPMWTEMRTHGPLSAGLVATRPRTHQVPVASPLAITVDDRRATGVTPHTGCVVENLEAFSVAHACHLGNIPFAAVLGVTHVVGSHGLEDWRRFGRDAAILAAEVLATWLHAGAQGLPH
ncbi:MAG: hypothetical protein ACOCXM_11630 [Myxococcota bacterium]